MPTDMPTQPVEDQTPLSGVDLIRAERERQTTAERWSPAHDDAHNLGEMAGAAAVYTLNSCGFENPHTIAARRGSVSHEVRIWPWADAWWKPSDPLRDLVKAGALIAAEIDRRQRLALKTERDALDLHGNP